MSENAGKRPIGVLSSYLMCGMALCMPHRVRIVFTFLINFIYNKIIDSVKVVIAVINACLVSVLIFMVYFIIVGLCALLQRLLCGSFIPEQKRRISYFLDKEPPDETMQRFQRQY